MKKLVIVFIGLFLMAFSMNVNAQNPTSTATANSAATIITPILIEKVDGKDLMFGNIIADADGGTVTIDLAGVSSENGVERPSVAGTISQAQFLVTGLANTTFGYTIPGNLTLTGDGDDMPVALTNDAGGNLDTSGEETINVGGTLTVNSAQAAGLYTATFDVTVVYN